VIINYSDEEVVHKTPSIFLAGPSPRDTGLTSWRVEATRILQELGFLGVVYVPEQKDRIQFDYLNQVSWEQEALTACDVIVFWVPRNMKTFPALTTNIEFGQWIPSGKCVYGRPDKSEKNRYLDWFYKEHTGKEHFNTLEEALKEAIIIANQKAEKTLSAKMFFTSDTHFSQRKSIEMSRRPFYGVSEMDDTIVSNWNKMVGKNDTVYHLGDFGKYEVAKRLNGNIVLVMGNYEQEDMWERFGGDFKLFSRYLKDLEFSDVIEKSCEIEIAGIEGEKVHLTHKPLDCKDNQLNLFGHIHEKCLIKEFGVNVGIDNFHFRPASTEDIIFYKNAIHYYDKHVFSSKKDLKKLSKD